MANLLRRILDRLGGDRKVSAQDRVFLAAFGKHPGWDDHIDDLGLDTQTLVDLKRLLYVQGIGANIDSGAWDAIDQAHRLPGYNHAFLWQAGDDLLVGRLWSSRDSKGRGRYPMVVCAHCSGLPVSWILENVPPLLEALRQRCVATALADEVRATLHDARRTLRRRVVEADLAAAPGWPDDAIATLAARPDMGPDREGMFRVLYHVQERMKAFRPAKGGSGSAETVPLANDLRVPTCAGSWPEAARLWLAAMRRLVAADVPVLAVGPVDRDWMDVLVGDPGPPHFLCLLSDAETVPLTTRVPYSLDEAFRDRAAKVIDGTSVPAAEGAAAGARPRWKARPKAAPGAAPRPPWRSWPPRHLPHLVGLLIVVVAFALVLSPIDVLYERFLRSPAGSGPAGQAVPAHGPWPDLCRDYYDWFFLYLTDVNEDFSRAHGMGDKAHLDAVRARRARWEQDAFLKGMLADADLFVSEKLDPPTLFGDPAMSPRRLAMDPDGHPPEKGREASVEKAWQSVSRVRSGTIQEWPDLRRLTGLRETWQGRRWVQRSERIKRLVEDVKPTARLASAIDGVDAAMAAVDRSGVEAMWARLEACRQVVRKAADTQGTPLEEFDASVEAAMRDAAGVAFEKDLEELSLVLKRWTSEPDGLAVRLAGFVGDFWPEGVDGGSLPPPPSDSSESGLAAWLASAQGCVIIPAALPPELTNGLASLAGTVQAARADLDAWPPRVKDRATDAWQGLDGRLKTLEADLDAKARVTKELQGKTWTRQTWSPAGQRAAVRLAQEVVVLVGVAGAFLKEVRQKELAGLEAAVAGDVRPPLVLWEDSARREAEAGVTRFEGQLRVLREKAGAEAAVSARDMQDLRSEFASVLARSGVHPIREWEQRTWGPWRLALARRIEEDLVRGGPPDEAGPTATERRQQGERLRGRLDGFQGSVVAAGVVAATRGGIDELREVVRDVEDDLRKTVARLNPDPRRVAEWQDRMDEASRHLAGVKPQTLALAGLANASVLGDRVDAGAQQVSASLDAVETLMGKVPPGQGQGAVAWKDVPDRAAVRETCERIEAELKGLSARVDRLTQSHQAARRLAGGVRGLLAAEPFDQAALRGLWHRERGHIAEAAVAALPEDLGDFAAEAAKREADLDAKRRKLAALLQAVSDRFRIAPGREALAKRRDAMLAQAMGTLPDPIDYTALPLPDAAQGLAAYLDQTPVAPVAKAWDAFVAGAGQLARLFTIIERGLNEGKGLGERPSGSDRTLQQLYADAKGLEVFKDSPFDGPIKRLQVLNEVEGTSEASRLVELAKRPERQRYEGARAAWLKLGTRGDWPATPEDLATERRIRAGLLAAGAPPDELNQEGRKRWERFFLGLRNPAAAGEAVRSVQEFNLKGDLARANPEGLLDVTNPLARYRVVTCWLAAAAAESADEAALVKVRDNFVALARKHAAGVCEKPKVKAVLDELLALQPGQADGGDLSRIGPGAVGWQLADQSSDRVTYTWHDLTLEFIRVQPPGADPCYLCTTEVSVGLVADWMDAGSHWAEGRFKALLEAGREKCNGPRTWRTIRDGAGTEASEAWVKYHADHAVVSPYPSAPPPPPTREHPMNYIAPDVALYFARLMGCRLPTSAEWLAARGQVPGSGGGNLRDKTWATQRDYATQHAEDVTKRRPALAGVERYPDEGIFLPAADVPRGKNAKQVTEESDGVLWFDKVASDTGNAFHHLVGNVAEYVFEDAKAQEQKGTGLDPSGPDAGKIFSLLAAGEAQLKVVGASALSPPEVKPSAPAPCRLNFVGSGCSDVGFRLAFTAPRATFRERLGDVLMRKTPSPLWQ